MGFWKRLFGRGTSDTHNFDRSGTVSSNDLSDIRLVMAISEALAQNFKKYPPAMAAAVIMAMTEKNREDLVERPEGIYLSRQCWERISTYRVWLVDDGELIITRKKFDNRPDEPKKDSQKFLSRRLERAKKAGGIDSLQYALGLALTFGLDQGRFQVKKDQTGMAII